MKPKIVIPPEVVAKAARLGHDPLLLAQAKKDERPGDADFWTAYLAMPDDTMRELRLFEGEPTEPASKHR